MKKVFKIAAALLSIATVYACLSFCFNHQFSRDEIRIKNFYREPKNTLDVVLLGGSTVQTDYSPALAWEEYGYTSYSLSVASVKTPELKPMLKEVRKRHKDALVLVDVGCVYYTEQADEITLRRLTDNMPFFSKARWEAIWELVPPQDRVYHYFPLSYYHNNWKRKEDLLDCLKYSLENLEIMFRRDRLTMRGITGIALQYPADIYVDYEGNTDTMPLHADSEEYLRDLLEYCKESGEDNIIFVRMPRYYNEARADEYLMINEAMRIVEEYGYPAMNYDGFISEIGLVADEDYYNQTHMNIYGQEKFTRYLGEYLSRNVLPDQIEHSERVAEAWDEEYRAYRKLYAIIESDMPEGKEDIYGYDTLKKRLKSAEQ